LIGPIPLETLQNLDTNEMWLSTDFYHEQFIPLQYIANIMLEAREMEFKIDKIDIRSSMTTYDHDIDLVGRLSELTNIPITSTSYNAYNGYFKGQGGAFKMPKEVFQNFSAVVYSFGEDSGYDPLFGPRGTNVIVRPLVRKGVATKFLKSKEVFSHPQMSEYVKQHISGDDEDYAPRGKISPHVMPNGSLLCSCGWDEQNFFQTARVGVYPEMSIDDFYIEMQEMEAVTS